MTLRCGDSVKHKPSGEEWVVSYVDGEYLSWLGWPNGEAKVSDCELIRSCSHSDHIKILKSVAAAGDHGADKRSRMARRDLEALAATIGAGTTQRDNFDKLTIESDAARAEVNRTHGLWTAATERLRRLEELRREACLEVVDTSSTE